MYKNLLNISILGIVLSFCACTNYKELKQTMGNEIQHANTCINEKSQELETDCYDLISYKNSIALLRLGRKAYYEGKYEEALKRYSLAKVRGNFYANALLSELYEKGKGVKQNKTKAIKLLEETKDADPIAAYKLALVYIKKENYKKALKLLEFASNNDLKEAQYKLLQLYKIDSLDIDQEKIKNLYLKYEDKTKDFKKSLYGL